MATELNETQRQTLKADLLELKQSLEELLTATEAGAKPVQLKDNKGRLTRMDEMHNQSILLANRNITRNRLKQVIIAMAHMEDGSYGYCRICDEPIAYPRLKAYPEADLCIECKAEDEQR